MISNFLQKPLGAVAILTAAVGGPYAAFETEVGTSLRRSLMSNMADSSSSPSGPPSSSGSGLWETSSPGNSTDPYSLVSAKNVGLSGQYPQNWNPSSMGAPTSYQSVGPNGQMVSTTYGPATIVPLSMPPALENQSGTSNVIPGNTDQLWDYTLGTPSLPQLQQHPQTSVGGGIVTDLREVLRFDIAPSWLPQRFARVTTVTSNVRMDGLRVPLITGTRPSDVAGSLTYFFDAAKSLQRIQLHGMTGDPGQLAQLMVQYYHLQVEPSLGGQLLAARWNNRITSVLQIAPAPIIYAGADHSKYVLFLELNQPSNQYGLSDEASEILRNSQGTQRW